MPKHLNGANMTDNSRQGSRSSEGAGSGTETEGGSPAHEFNQAVERLESSLRDLVDSKKDASLRQATTLIEEASSRLRSQTAEGDADAVSRRARRRRHRYRGLRKRRMVLRPGSDHLYRGPNKKIGGVCAGFARYLGIETWTVRLAAVTGLIFVPGLTLPAYIAACFIMDSEPGDGATAPRRSRGSMRARRRQSKRGASLLEGAENAGVEQGSASDTEHRSGQTRYAGEILQWPPRRMLTHSRAELAQAELRLRRIESFVTSDQYELHKELRKMEQ